MMEAAVIPPFELFYEEHRDEVFGVLVRRLGRQRAEDAFQETFLRALRAYPALRHGEHLRAWVLTIARNVAVDSFRREKPTVELDGAVVELAAPPRLRGARASDRRAAADRAGRRRPPLRLRHALRRDRRRARLVRGRGAPGRFGRRPPPAEERSTHERFPPISTTGSATPRSARASSTSPTTSPTRRSASCSSPPPTGALPDRAIRPGRTRSTSSPPTSAPAS